MFKQKQQKFKRLDKTLKVFIVALIIGLQLAFLVSYLYINYRDLIRAEGQIPDTITYQGKIINDEGVPPPDGDYQMKFVIYDADTGGNVLWTELWDNTDQDPSCDPVGSCKDLVTVTDGVFAVELNSLCSNWVGGCASNGGVTFSDASFYLEVQLDYDGDDTYEEVFSPRKRFTAIPFSMNTDKIDGLDSTAFLLKAGDSMEGDLTVPTLIADKISDNSLVALYEFSGDEKDSGPNSLDGVIQNEAIVSNQVLELDGVDQYVSVTDDDLLSLVDATSGDDTGLTVSAWLNMTDATNFEILNKGIFNSNAEYRLFINNNDKLEIRLYDESVVDCYIGQLYDTAALTDFEGIWINVTATYDGLAASSGIKLYLNGNPLSSVTNELNAASYVAMENLNANTYIGRYDTNYANGKLDDLVIYDRALTADEIKRIYSKHNRNSLQTGNLTSRGINLYDLDDEDADDIKEVEGGNLVWDAVYNRFKFDAELYAPNIIPYFNNSVQDRDYTYIADDNKVMAYDFNESNGTTVTDLETNANATLNGDVSWTNNGYIGYGMKFDDEEDYLEISTDLRNVMSSTQGSLEMWVRLNDITSSNDSYLLRLAELTTNEISIYKNYTDVSNLADLYVSVGNSGAVDTGWDFPDNNWHHLVLTYDSNDLDVFVDGISVYSEESAYTSLNVSTFSSLYLGTKATTGINGLNGFMDSVAIYDDVLTADEISNHYNAAFHNLYVSGLISDGIMNTDLADLMSLPANQTSKSKIDPVYHSDANIGLSLGFSEAGGDTAASQNGDLGAAVNGANWIQNGYYGPGMSFDGVDDNLVVLDTADVHSVLDFGTADFSIEFWLKGEDDGQSGADNSDARIISKKDETTGQGYEIFLDSNDRVQFYLSDGTDTYTSSSNGLDISSGVWQYVLLAFDMTNDSVYINRDGWNYHTIDISAANIDSLDNTADLYIGSDASGNYYDGELDSIVTYKNRLLNIYDSYQRVNNGPQYLIVNNNVVSSNSAAAGIINQSDNGSALSLANTSTNNTAEYPLIVSNLAATSNIYNLISFSNFSSVFGNLQWDSGNSKFILDKSLEVQGDLEVDYLMTDANELLAYDTIRHTITSGEASGVSISESWNKATVAKIVNLHAVNSTGSLVSGDDWTNGGSYVDLGTSYNGSSITVIKQNGTWAEGDVVTIFIVYEK